MADSYSRDLIEYDKLLDRIQKLEKALREARQTLDWYATPGIHERWKAEEALAKIDEALKLTKT